MGSKLLASGAKISTEQVNEERDAMLTKWDASPQFFKQASELEAVLEMTRITTKLTQYEQKYSGGFSSLIKGTTMRALRKSSLRVIDLEKIGQSPHVPRKELSCRAAETHKRCHECSERMQRTGESHRSNPKEYP